MNYNITLIPGDGIGPEVVAEAVRVLDTIASNYGHSFKFTERLMGGCSIDKFGSSLTEETLADCPERTDPSAACSLCEKGSVCSQICVPSKCTTR